MNGLSLRWKLFRLLCIIQLIMVVYSLVLNAIRLFSSSSAWREGISVASYSLIFVFLCQGLSILSDNYPDTPLTLSQKRRFNLLFLLNFLLIAFLFSKVVNAWWVFPLIHMGSFSGSFLVNLLYILLQTVFVFIFHLLFLFGMYRLRRIIHQNTLTGWYRQFDQQEPR